MMIKYVLSAILILPVVGCTNNTIDNNYTFEDMIEDTILKTVDEPYLRKKMIEELLFLKEENGSTFDFSIEYDNRTSQYLYILGGKLSDREFTREYVRLKMGN